MRWPHQSCRDTHQSWMFSSQPYHTFSNLSGTNRSSFLRAASIAFAAIPYRGSRSSGEEGRKLTSILMNHCSDSIGSITSPLLWLLGIRCECFFVSKPSPLS
jgi:hypothetical protein